MRMGEQRCVRPKANVTAVRVVRCWRLTGRAIKRKKGGSVGCGTKYGPALAADRPPLSLHCSGLTCQLPSGRGPCLSLSPGYAWTEQRVGGGPCIPPPRNFSQGKGRVQEKKIWTSLPLR